MVGGDGGGEAGVGEALDGGLGRGREDVSRDVVGEGRGDVGAGEAVEGLGGRGEEEGGCWADEAGGGGGGEGREDGGGFLYSDSVEGDEGDSGGVGDF